jgi:hypothetical protein
MNKNFKNSIAIVVLLFSSTILVAQNNNTLQVGMLSTFDAYTSDGPVLVNGTVYNDIGSGVGLISGSHYAVTTPPSTYTGETHNNNDTTDICKEDLLRAYIHLCNVYETEPGTHAPSFGAAPSLANNQAGETLSPGVYSIGEAGSVANTLTLSGNQNSVFIFKFDGALSIAASANMVLQGARAENIYWIAEGAVTVGANSNVRGTLIAHPGDVLVGANCTIEGRLLSTTGAITIGSNSTVEAPMGNIRIRIGFFNDRPTASAVDVLRTLDSIVMFSGNGAVSNGGLSGIIGNIGAAVGSVGDFVNSTIIGVKGVVGDAAALQAKLDLDTALTELNALSSDSTITTALGGGDTMTAGVYDITGAGSLSGRIILNAQNDSDAIFVFRIGGAFDVAAQSKVIFYNGARLTNVFWVSGGAVSLGTFSYLKGTLIATGACSAGANANVEGRILSKTGAVSFSTGVLYVDPEYFAAGPGGGPVPVKLLSFTAEAVDGNVDLNWVTASELNNDYFNIEYSKDGSYFTPVITRTGAGNSTEKISYSATHNTSEQGTIYYKLKQTDFDGTTSYSDIVAVDLSVGIDVTFKVSPNPIHNKAIITTSENLHDASLSVYNSHMMVKQVNNLSGRSFTFQREDLKTGLYWISLVQDGQVISTKKVVLTD